MYILSLHTTLYRVRPTLLSMYFVYLYFRSINIYSNFIIDLTKYHNVKIEV